MIKNNFPLIVIDNFFSNIDYLLPYLKKIPLYNQSEFNEKFKDHQTWPGYRSEDLTVSERPLTMLIKKTIEDLKLPMPKQYGIRAFLHLRLSSHESEDWIHKDNEDNCFKTCIVYLSETNFNSGTNFYLHKNKDTLFADIKFINNYACMFNAGAFHRSGLNFGSNIDNGRLTLNLFFYDL
tara:strand:- start:227 stop:766 length:540 start_codon:yes stop_codon:yes gene_type:complete